MAKGESLMGEVATDWMDTECPEAKRLKVVFPPVTLTLRSWVGAQWAVGEPGESLLFLVPENSHSNHPILLLASFQRGSPIPESDSAFCLMWPP